MAMPAGVTNRGVIVSIAGVTLSKGVSACTVGYQDLSDQDSGRGMDGTMWKGYIGTIRTLECNFSALQPQVIKDILTAVKGQNSFSVEWYDPETGDYETSDFYVGDRKADFKVFYNNHELIGLTMKLIEISPYT